MAVQKITREEIIQKSVKIFTHNGYHDTSIADLASLLGIKNALIYYYFRDKEDLMHEVLKYVYQLTINKFDLLMTDASLSPLEKISKINRFIEKLYLNSPGGCIMGNTALEASAKVHINENEETEKMRESNEPKFIEIVKAYFGKWIEVMTQIFLSKYQEPKARELAEATVQDIEGSIMMTKLFKDSRFLLHALKRSEKLLD